MSKLHVKKGDEVVILAGKDKGATGRILKVFIKTQRAIVEGRNMMKKSAKPSANNPQGGFEEKEAPIHISNLALNIRDSKTGKLLKIGRKRNSEGRLVRYVKTTGEEIK
ncbi:50S ribosomal protein L24 [Dysgonomonas sp. 25]|uniref:50S ribosomal protein L24 n=1 Tax=Dysgonomonas sp. 25 TaxID=2302933 RepID=UPI0013D3F301|nr:50S ribosomal protein L24 [Dysgonomonas sp. 25]NDV69817.1 50S ribosomal protein L24 [Dysgonomonas sp. 25]